MTSAIPEAQQQTKFSQYSQPPHPALLKMDPDFWQQARNPFGLQYLQQQQQQHSLQLHEHHQPNLQHPQAASIQPHQQQQHHHHHSDQSHHLLFNAAAAAHLSGVVRSHDLQSGLENNVNERNVVDSKQEVQNSTSKISTSGRNLSHTVPLAPQQKYPPPTSSSDYDSQLRQEQNGSHTDTAPIQSDNSDLYGNVQPKQEKQQQIQQQHHNQQHQKQQQTLSGTSTELHASISSTMVQQLPPPAAHPLGPSSPLQISTVATTQSPQHSMTPSGGSSTPDVKYNSDKLANEIQLQLSRSSSAAAISERTLEECWSTLQRLFMHKSAMQQIQQIPRVGLGAAGGHGSLAADTKPHQCQQCMKSFSSNHQLVQHIRVHTGEKPYKCSYCDRRFKQLSHVQQHTRLHTGERPYKCHLPDCGRAFIQLSNLQQHLRNHDAQVERAKNRPFHCNICGKGFATESSLRTHTSKELQLHLGVLQQHAALIGGPNATSCPVCHKLFLGTEPLMEHMKHAHKEKSPQPMPGSFIDNINSSTCMQTSSNASSNDPYLAKRRTANHPCPVCGKHYVNEGSLRKHLASHPETSQLTNSLRMWPCSVCQAVFTHENGLLTHMEHMRMDPKHQFAAQYVLSRAAAERRERDSLLAATLAGSVPGVGTGCSVLPLLGESGEAGVSNSLCPSPSGNSECSSTGRLSSSTNSEQGSGINLLNNNNNNNNNSNNNNNHTNNNNGSSNNNSCNSNKLNELLLRTGNSQMAVGQYGVDAAVQAAVVNLAAAMRCSGVAGGTNGALPSIENNAPSYAGQLTTQHLAQPQQQQHQSQPSNPNTNQSVNSPLEAARELRTTPVVGAPSGDPAAVSAAVAMNVMRDMTMMRTSIATGESLANMHQTVGEPHIVSPMHHHNATIPPNHSYSGQHNNTINQQHGINHPTTQTPCHPANHLNQHHLSQQSHQTPEAAAMRMQQHAEALLRSHTEAAFRLAASVAASNGAGSTANNNVDGSPATATSIIKTETQNQHKPHQRQNICGDNEVHTNQQQSSSAQSSVSTLEQQQNHEQKLSEQSSSQQQQPSSLQQQHQHTSPQAPPQEHLQDAIRLQEQRLEQALRLHNDARTLSFFTTSGGSQQPTHMGGIQHTQQSQPQQQHHSSS